MIRKWLRKIARPIVGKVAASVISRAGDDLLKRELDKRTGGLASRIDEVL